MAPYEQFANERPWRNLCRRNHGHQASDSFMDGGWLEKVQRRQYVGFSDGVRTAWSKCADSSSNTSQRKKPRAKLEMLIVRPMPCDFGAPVGAFIRCNKREIIQLATNVAFVLFSRIVFRKWRRTDVRTNVRPKTIAMVFAGGCSSLDAEQWRLSQSGLFGQPRHWRSGYNESAKSSAEPVVASVARNPSPVWPSAG